MVLLKKRKPSAKPSAPKRPSRNGAATKRDRRHAAKSPSPPELHKTPAELHAGGCLACLPIRSERTVIMAFAFGVDIMRAPESARARMLSRSFCQVHMNVLESMVAEMMAARDQTIDALKWSEP